MRRPCSAVGGDAGHHSDECGTKWALSTLMVLKHQEALLTPWITARSLEGWIERKIYSPQHLLTNILSFSYDCRPAILNMLFLLFMSLCGDEKPNNTSGLQMWSLICCHTKFLTLYKHILDKKAHRKIEDVDIVMSACSNRLRGSRNKKC